jgi:hypothetical protein
MRKVFEKEIVAMKSAHRVIIHLVSKQRRHRISGNTLLKTCQRRPEPLAIAFRR